MKKLFVMMMSLTVLAFPACAETMKILKPEAHKKVEAILSQEHKKAAAMYTAVLDELAAVRKTLAARTTFNGAFIIQDLTGLMDRYIALANVSEEAAVSLNGEINQPVEAGWGETVTIAQLVRDNSHYVMAGTSTADDFDRFESLLGKKTAAAPVTADIHVKMTVAAAPKYADKAGVKEEAAKTFKAYFSANPDGKVQKAAYAPLAELLAASCELNALIARTTNIDDKENYAAQFFFSQDIAGKYAALKAVNPKLAAATNNLMKSFIETVSNGLPDYMPQKDVNDYKKFGTDIGYIR